MPRASRLPKGQRPLPQGNAKQDDTERGEDFPHRGEVSPENRARKWQSLASLDPQAGNESRTSPHSGRRSSRRSSIGDDPRVSRPHTTTCGLRPESNHRPDGCRTRNEIRVRPFTGRFEWFYPRVCTTPDSTNPPIFSNCTHSGDIHKFLPGFALASTDQPGLMSRQLVTHKEVGTAISARQYDATCNLSGAIRGRLVRQ